MAITFLSFSGLLAPFRQLVGWLAAAPPREAARVRTAIAVNPGAALRRRHRPRMRTASAGAARTASLPPRRPLRVLRVVDTCHAPSAAGRMMISGRMADVCAELERLAAHEAAATGRA